MSSLDDRVQGNLAAVIERISRAAAALKRDTAGLTQQAVSNTYEGYEVRADARDRQRGFADAPLTPDQPSMVIASGDGLNTVLGKLRAAGVDEGSDTQWQLLARQLDAADTAELKAWIAFYKSLRDRLLPLVSLQTLLGLEPAGEPPAEACIIVARVGAFTSARLDKILALMDDPQVRARHMLVDLPLPGGGALLALQREGVLVLAADAVAARHDVGRVDHGHVQRGLVLDQPGVHVGGQVVAGADARDGLDAAGQHGVHALGHDAARRDGDGLQARGAKARDGRARDGQGQLGAQHGLAAQVAALEAVGVTAAQDQVLDHGRVDARALDRGLDREGRQLGGGRDVELAAVRLGQGRAGSGNDDGFAHGRSLLVSWEFLLLVAGAAQSGTPRKGLRRPRHPTPRVSSPSRVAREGEAAQRLRG